MRSFLSLPPSLPLFLWCVGYVRMPRPLVGSAYPTSPPFCSQFILDDGALVIRKKKKGPHIYECSLFLSEVESTKTGEKTSGNNTAGELNVLENSLDFFFLGPQGPLRRPICRFASFVFLLSLLR